MDKSLIVYILVGLGFMYLLTNFVNDLQEDDRLQTAEYKQAHRFDKYLVIDELGETVLDLRGTDEKEQKAAWNGTAFKEEMLDMYPQFDLMQAFVEERVKGEPIRSMLLKRIDEAEGKLISGEADELEVKRMLSTL